jgi:hypothetical protein
MPMTPRHQPNIDIAGSIGGLGDALQQGLEFGRKRRIERATRQAFQEGIPTGPDGTPDYTAMAARLFQLGDVDTGLGLTRLAETQLQNEFLRGKPQFVGGPRGSQYVVTGDPNAPLQEVVSPEPERPIVAPSTSDVIDPNTREVIRKGRRQRSSTQERQLVSAQDELTNLGPAIDLLEEANRLIDQGVFQGYGSGARTAIGANLPEDLTPDALRNVLPDKATAERTQRYQQIMSIQAVEQMANSLKGATSDRDVATFLRLVADPNAATSTKLAATKQLLTKLKANRDLLSNRVKSLETIDQPAEDDVTAGPAEDAGAEPPDASGGDYPVGTIIDNPATGQSMIMTVEGWVPYDEGAQ